MKTRSAKVLFASSVLLATAVAANAQLARMIESAQPANPKMTSEFQSLVETLRAQDTQSRRAMIRGNGSERAAPIIRLKGDKYDSIEAYVWLASWQDSVIDAVAKAGAEIVLEDPSRQLLQVWIPLNRVEAVAAVDGVRHLRRPSYALPAAGSITTEGDALMATSFVRARGGVDGTGIKVGVLSQGLFNNQFPSSVPVGLGVNEDERVTSGNLPFFPSATPPNVGWLGGVDIFPDSLNLHDVTRIGELDNNGFPEGAAVLEILYDIAPGADVLFAGVDTDIELISSRSFLLNRGVDVILDDLIFFDSGRFDGTSVISRGAQQIALEEDVVYVVAAGNQSPLPADDIPFTTPVQARRFPLFVNGYFTPSASADDARFHNWSSGREPNISRLDLPIRPVSGIIDVVLVWDDVWDDVNPRATDDMDLYLFGDGGVEAGKVVASSVDAQNFSNNPIERITKQITGTEGTQFQLALTRKDQTNTARTLFSIIILQGSIDPAGSLYLTHGIPGNNGDARPPVISVGSIDAVTGINVIDEQTVPGIDPGPGRRHRNDFVQWYTTQESPAVVSYTNVTTLSMRGTGPGGDLRLLPFTGSSAAAAHVAGLATLLRHSFYGIPSWEFYDLFRSSEPDPIFGEFPNATPLYVDKLADFLNPPSYFRLNGFDTWANIDARVAADAVPRSVAMSTTSPTASWESSEGIEPFNQPLFSQSALGLGISPGGQADVFGFWQTPVLAFRDYEGNLTQALRSDRIYELTVRVGTDETDPTRVPDFRLRLTTGGNDESALLVVAGLDPVASNVPDSIAGKEYKLYYRPSNPAIAAQGLRFAFDLVHFSESDNPNATLYLQDIRLRELDLP